MASISGNKIVYFSNLAGFKQLSEHKCSSGMGNHAQECSIPQTAPCLEVSTDVITSVVSLSTPDSWSAATSNIIHALNT